MTKNGEEDEDSRRSYNLIHNQRGKKAARPIYRRKPDARFDFTSTLRAQKMHATAESI